MTRKHCSGAVAAVALLLSAAAHAAGAPSCSSVTLPNSGGYANGGTFDFCKVDTQSYPDALCNDGTAPVFQLQPSAGSTTWVIWLQGGYQCVDAASCEQRATNPKTEKLVTSKGVKAGVGHGLLSHDPNLNPALAAANTVSVHYCSSDAWSGGYLAPNGPDGFDPSNTATWNFAGRAIVKAVLMSLLRGGFGFGQASQIVLGGSSAGAAGITYTVRDLLPHLPEQAQVLLVNDAGFVLDVGGYDKTLPSPYERSGDDTPTYRQLNQGRLLWHGHADAACNAQAKTPREHTDCYDTSRLLQGGYVTVPVFVDDSQLDTPELLFQICPARNGKCATPHNPDSKTGVYATHYAQQMAALISENGASSLPYTAYSPDTYIHTMLNLDAEFSTPLRFQGQNLSPRDVFDDWLANPTAPGQAYLGTGPGVQ